MGFPPAGIPHRPPALFLDTMPGLDGRKFAHGPRPGEHAHWLQGFRFCCLAWVCVCVCVCVWFELCCLTWMCVCLNRSARLETFAQRRNGNLCHLERQLITFCWLLLGCIWFDSRFRTLELSPQSKSVYYWYSRQRVDIFWYFGYCNVVIMSVLMFII